MSIKPLYRPLDISKSEIRLISFQSEDNQGRMHLTLHHVSLSQWKAEYVSFRDRNAVSGNISDLTELWIKRHAATDIELHNAMERFIWGDYICLSYTWGDHERQDATVFVDGFATAVSRHLAAALRDLRENFHCKLGMRIWVDALCINHADAIDRNIHVLQAKNIFEGAFSVTIWTNEQEDPQSRGLSQPGERLILCNLVLRRYGREVLEQLLGVRSRNWGEAGDEDKQLMTLAEEVDELAFDQYHWSGSDDDEFVDSGQHLRDLVRVELWFILKEAYWSRLWIIQELAVSPATSTVHWGELAVSLSTLQAVGEILLANGSTDVALEFWQELKPRLDLLAFITAWKVSKSTAANMDRSEKDVFFRKLKPLAERASCSLPHDHVYGLLGLFPTSVQSAVTIDYRREATDVVAEFDSAVARWISESDQGPE